MKIENPYSSVLNDDRSVKLYFDWDEDKMLYPQADFDIRGGVCWPVTFRKDGAVDSSGYILVAGLNLENNVITIFEQQSFMVIESIINQESMQIEYPGISNFFNNAFSKYYCGKYYWHQNFELTKKWRLDVLRSPAISPKPHLIEVPWGDDRDADHLIWSLIKMRRLRQDLRQDLKNQLEEVKLKPQGKRREIFPAVRALQCVLMGFQRFPLKRNND